MYAHGPHGDLKEIRNNISKKLQLGRNNLLWSTRPAAKLSNAGFIFVCINQHLYVSCVFLNP